MASIELKYGNGSIPFEYDPDRSAVLGQFQDQAMLTDAEINERLDRPVGTETIEQVVGPDDTVLIVVPDATREVGCGQIVNLVVRRLIANGTFPGNIRIIFATGIHRSVTEVEKARILTPFIAQRIKTLEHSPRDLVGSIRLGETTAGIPIELNRALVEHDRVIIIGGASFHYFAGFTGGRKLICPGLASSKTVSETHKLAFDCSTLTRRNGVGTALLDGNAVNEAFEEAAAMVDPCFAITSIVNDSGGITDLFCGHWRKSHRAACDAVASRQTIELTEKRSSVIVSCGGYPHDVNVIQAHKSLEAASHACVDGGEIILLAECPDGSGRSDFLDWFALGRSEEMALGLCEKYKVNGQTAWNLRRISERFQVKIISSLDHGVVRTMGMVPINAGEIATVCGPRRSRFILPAAAKVNIIFDELNG